MRFRFVKKKKKQKIETKRGLPEEARILARCPKNCILSREQVYSVAPVARLPLPEALLHRPLDTPERLPNWQARAPMRTPTSRCTLRPDVTPEVFSDGEIFLVVERFLSESP